jgi:PAS domain S-box-containing protein
LKKRFFGFIGFNECKESRIWIEEDIDILKTVSHIVAKTIEARRADEELRARKTFLRNVFNAIQDGICVMDKDLRVLRVNQTIEHWYAENMPFEGKRCFETFHGKTVPCEACPSKRAISEKTLQRDMIAFKRPNGTKGWFEIYAFPMLDVKGEVYGVIEYVRDVTQRKITEDALVETHLNLKAKVEERTMELLETTEKLKQRQDELLVHKSELEKVNKELLSTSQAVTVLARNIDKSREEAEKRIAMTISTKIMPILEGLGNKSSRNDPGPDLATVMAYMNQITASIYKGVKVMGNLTSTEMRVAAMIGKGLSTSQIADTLCVSVDTVKTHRRSIRRKLQITGSDTNLTAHIKSFSS